MEDAAYTGLKVIDLSQGVAGPYCAMLLAQHGADVIKVEPVEGGDWSRGLGPRFGDQTAYSIPANLGKRSIALDLKQEAGRTVLSRLVRGADVFLQGFRPGVIDRLGFGYNAVRAIVPSIVYVSISGFGQTGPLAERPAMDPVLQAYTGLTAENAGEDGIPHRVPIIPIDMTCALYAFAALAAALHARRDSGRGRHIEASLMQAGACLQVVRMLQHHLEGGQARPPAAPSGVYRLADGWINITVARQHEWVAFCQAVELPALTEDTRFAAVEGRTDHAEILRALLRPVLAPRHFEELSERLAAHRVMHERLNTYAEFLNQPHVIASGAIGWVAHPAIPGMLPLPNVIGAAPFRDDDPRARAPALSEHNEAILREHGYS
ncbi:MAG TPA: CoA transferase, partial [Acetobacteraceae bacterium]|nr:CoA transferase [Acetobacteraceae bacterium]